MQTNCDMWQVHKWYLRVQQNQAESLTVVMKAIDETSWVQISYLLDLSFSVTQRQCFYFNVEAVQ